MPGLSVHRCPGRRSPQPPAFLGPACPQGLRPLVIAHRPAQPSRAAVRRPARSRSRPSGLPSPQAARALEGGSSLSRHRRGQAGR